MVEPISGVAIYVVCRIYTILLWPPVGLTVHRVFCIWCYYFIICATKYIEGMVHKYEGKGDKRKEKEGSGVRGSTEMSC